MVRRDFGVDVEERCETCAVRVGTCALPADQAAATCGQPRVRLRVEKFQRALSTWIPWGTFGWLLELPPSPAGAARAIFPVLVEPALGSVCELSRCAVAQLHAIGRVDRYARCFGPDAVVPIQEVRECC